MANYIKYDFRDACFQFLCRISVEDSRNIRMQNIVATYFSNKNLTFSTKIFQEELALIRWV